MVRLLLIAMLLAAPTAAWAQASVCAALAEAGAVPRAAGEVIAIPTPRPDRRLKCPYAFRLDLGGRLPVCRRAGLTRVDGSPRAMCYQALPVGPIAELAPRSRPTRSCATPANTSILRLEGANIGLSDVALTVTPAAGITITTLAASGGDVPEAEDPVLQGCFGFRCRLVKLEATALAAAEVRLRASAPGGEPAEVVIKLPEDCAR